MTSKQKEKKLILLKEVLAANGFEEDNYGNFKKTVKDNLYRYKFNKTSLRYESQVIHSDGSKCWVRLRSGYYKDLTVNELGKIVGLTV